MQDSQQILDNVARYTMTIGQASTYLGITPRAVKRLIERNRLQTIRFKDRRVIPFDSVESYRRWKLYRSRGYTMGLYANTNLYQGVNPHLMSLYQTPGWGAYQGFHSDHITDLKRFIRRQLPSGYEAFTEDSLNILQGLGPSSRRESDVSIRASILQQPPDAIMPSGETPTARLTSKQLRCTCAC